MFFIDFLGVCGYLMRYSFNKYKLKLHFKAVIKLHTHMQKSIYIRIGDLSVLVLVNGIPRHFLGTAIQNQPASSKEVGTRMRQKSSCSGEHLAKHVCIKGVSGTLTV